MLLWPGNMSDCSQEQALDTSTRARCSRRSVAREGMFTAACMCGGVADVVCVQALLDKHERAMVEAEIERATLSKRIAALEDKTNQLELDNERKSDENRSLLHELEDLNENMTASESRTRELQEELDAAQVHLFPSTVSTHSNQCQAELSRLNGCAARAELLENQLAVLEREQESLRSNLSTSREEQRAANMRSKKAERALADLTEKLERIEMEHRMEKTRAQNLLERLEKRRLMDRNSRSFPSVLADRTAMSQYMKEVLAENSNLQNGIAELREMLLASQEEVANLRDELSNSRNLESQSPLSYELGAHSHLAAQEVHFHHHHYHQKASVRAPAQRTRKKRLALKDSHFASLGRIVEPASASPPSSALTSPVSNFNRWSNLSGPSTGTISSFPTSPTSINNRSSSIFDRTPTTDFTRPSSAESEYASKQFGGHARKPSITSNPPFEILSTTEEEHSVTSLARPASRLYRSASHESILSIIESQPSVSSTVVSNASYRTPFPVSSMNSQVAPQQIAASGRAATNASQKASSSLAYNRLLLSSAAAQRPEAPPSTFKTIPKWLWKWAPTPLGNLAASRSTENISAAASNTTPAVSPQISPAVPFLSAPAKAVPVQTVTLAHKDSTSDINAELQ